MEGSDEILQRRREGEKRLVMKSNYEDGMREENEGDRGRGKEQTRGEVK
jgi:hypothetical protein